MFLVFGWIRVVTVAVTVPNSSVLAVHNDLHLLAFGLLRCAFNHFLLRRQNHAGALSALLLGGLTIGMRHHVNIFLGHLKTSNM